MLAMCSWKKICLESDFFCKYYKTYMVYFMNVPCIKKSVEKNQKKKRKGRKENGSNFWTNQKQTWIYMMIQNTLSNPQMNLIFIYKLQETWKQPLNQMSLAVD